MNSLFSRDILTLKHIGILILSNIVAVVVISLITNHTDSKNVFFQVTIGIIIEFLILIFVLLFFQLKSFYHHRKIMTDFIDFVKNDNITDFTLHDIVSDRFKKLGQQLNEIFSEKGGKFYPSEVISLYKSFFKMDEEYVGTSKFVPSHYLTNLGPYIEESVKSQTRTGKKHIRILIVSRELLLIDYATNKKKYRQFLEKHGYDLTKSIDQQSPKVTLKFIEPSIEKDHAHGIIIREMGMWGNKFCIRIDQNYAKDGKIGLYYSSENNVGFETYNNYIQDIIKKSDPIPLEFSQKEIDDAKIGDETLNHVNEKLANSWDCFVGKDNREIQLNAFFDKIFGTRIDGEMTVLIMYSNTGIIPLMLHKRRNRVIALESDPFYNNIFAEKISDPNFKDPESKLERYKLQKNLIFHHFTSRHILFDAIFILDNCYIFEEESRRIEILKNCKTVLRPGGAVVIDQRNNTKILDFIKNCKKKGIKWNTPDAFYPNDKENGKKNRDKEDQIKYKNTAGFCGSKIRGWPYEINEEENTITFQYGISNENPIGTLTFSLISDDKIVEELKSPGLFHHVTSYSDYDPENPKMTVDADFFVHIAFNN